MSLWAIKTAVRLSARDFKALNISDSVVLSSALVASSQSLREKKRVRNNSLEEEQTIKKLN